MIASSNPTIEPWLKLLQECQPEIFFPAWMSCLVSGLEDVSEAVLVLGPANTGPFQPEALWPHRRPCSKDLMQLCDQVIDFRKPLFKKVSTGTCFVLPILKGDDLLGVTGVVFSSAQVPRYAKNWLYWGIGWLLAHPSTLETNQEGELSERLLFLLDLLMSVLAVDSAAEATQAVLTQAAQSLGCDRISFGLSQGQTVQLNAISNSADFSKKIDLTLDLRNVMNEATDQGEPITYPIDGDNVLITRSHAQLSARHGNGMILTVPFSYDDEHYGALTFEWPSADVSEELHIAEGIAALVGRILLEKHLQDVSGLVFVGRSMTRSLKRVFGPRYLGRKIILLFVLVSGIFLSLADGDFNITSDTRIEGSIRRLVVAPFDAFIAQSHFRAGQEVKKGDVLATLDDRDLTLELVNQESQQIRHKRERQEAQARLNQADAKIASAKIAQVAAQIKLIRNQIEKTTIVAPFQALITTGDLSQQLGGAVTKGQSLFELAPLHGYRVVIDVDESDISYLSVGQSGALTLKAFPGQQIDFIVDLITPVTQARGGRNTFRVEGTISQDHLLDLRPGMEGISKINVSQQKLIWIYTREVIDWSRLRLWKWFGV